jgi:glycosyltransferase involved in cell wall biosynthesis
MRIQIVTPEFPPHAGGGILKYYDLLASSLVAAGARVSVLVASPFSEFADYRTRDGVDVQFVTLQEVDEQLAVLPHLAAAPAVRRYLAAGLAAAHRIARRVDAIDAIETTDFGLVFAPLVSMADRPPVVVKMHGSLGQISEHEPVEPKGALDAALARMIEAALLPHADALVAYSPANAAEWEARLSTRVSFMPAPLRVTEQRQPEPTVYSGLVAARVQAWKGPQVLCEALASMGSQLPPDLRIAWAGRDTSTAPDGGSLGDWLAAEYPGIWGERIVPVGQQPASAIAALQASVRYVIVPSHWDTFNYTLAESMAAGCVTIGSAGAGASYLLQPDVNGYPFAAGDHVALAHELLRAHAAGDTHRTAIGAAAQATVAADLSPEAVAVSALGLMRGLSPRPAAARPTSWLREFIGYGVAPAAADDAFLENVSIKALGRHLSQRLRRRLPV